MRKALSVIVVLILVSVSFNLAKASYESYQKLKEVGNSGEQVKDLKKKNEELKQQVLDKQTNFFIEEQARNKLGFGKEGETIIVVQDEKLRQKEAEAKADKKSNLEKWIELLKI